MCLIIIDKLESTLFIHFHLMLVAYFCHLMIFPQGFSFHRLMINILQVLKRHRTFYCSQRKFLQVRVPVFKITSDKKLHLMSISKKLKK
ncbi:hypothetical protein BpHYR1_033045 [Brachionus plicatilis]|uniref:Uncharacterized protein n=1 Tax=Brachionus plicatilis TaxID=10195 RepID=A0A3M7RTV8_BRAPC|nr:hypothetical protein BpHYR1_033045 [Brachionus plicatilis]